MKRIAILAAMLTMSRAEAMTYQLAAGNESWPAEARAAIVAAMDEAVATFNANGHFDKFLWANYNPGVPTAQANYEGWIDFGGSISARTAMHEISHTLGVGTYWAWAYNQANGVWTGAYASARIRLFDGPSAAIGCDGMHFWPYGLNYANEDSPVARIRLTKIVSAMRRDMGIVGDSDIDGLPDDWEVFHFGNLSQTANGDPNANGIANLTEYNNDTDPGPVLTNGTILDWTGGNGTWDTTSAQWTGAATVWRNLITDTAGFGGSPGTVTVGSGVLCRQLQFTASDYLITGGSLELPAPAAEITCSAGPNTIASSLQGAGGLTKLGPGELLLSGTNSNAGATTVSAGTLVLGGNNSAMTAGTTVASGATLRLQANAGNTTGGICTALSGNVSGRFGLLGTLQLRSDNDVTFVGGDAMRVIGGTTLAFDVNSLNPGNTNRTISFATAGMQETYYNTINVTGGNGYTLRIGGILNADNSPLTLNVDGANFSIGDIGAASPASDLNVGGASNTAITGVIHANSLSKSGAGTLTLAGTNTYTGTTTVSGGRLLVSGNTSGTSSVNVATGATLEVADGNLAVGGNLTNHGTLVFTGAAQFSAGGTITNYGTIINRSPGLTLPPNIVNNGTIFLPPVAPGGLSATPGDGRISLSWSAVSGATGYKVYQSTVSGGPYTEVATPSATSQTITGLTNGTTYFLVVSTTNPAGESVNSGEASAAPMGLSLPFLTTDVGNVGLTGSASFLGGAYTIEGAGAGVSSNSDAFRFIYQNSGGNCSVTARVQSLTNTSAGARAGVVIRESLAGNARCAGVYLTPSNELQFLWRTSTGALAGFTTSGGRTAPYWVRLTRTNNIFRAYSSTNGSTWTQFGGNRAIAMASNAYIGTAVTSGTTAALATAVLTGNALLP